jgi:hypothetical protein
MNLTKLLHCQISLSSIPTLFYGRILHPLAALPQEQGADLCRSLQKWHQSAQPLRSDSQPMGMDGLSGLDKIKAECANITYENTCELMRLCIKLGIAVSLENPRTPFLEGTFGGSFSFGNWWLQHNF